MTGKKPEQLKENEMVEGLVTVVVPVYRVEKYLDRCVRSIAQQTYTNLEILLIDDGSPDNCPEICEQWARRDVRVRVFHKENAGLGYARNTGLDNARGEYVCFVDSDDCIERTQIEECFGAAKRENADVVCFGYDRVDEAGTVISEHIPKPAQQKFTGKEVVEKAVTDALRYDSELWLSACGCLISLRVVENHHWRFVSERDIISEDYYSMLELLAKVETLFVLKRIFYHYTVNQNSLSQTYRADRYEKIRYCAKAMSELVQRLGYVDVLSVGIASLYIGFVMGAMKQIVESGEPVGIRMKYLRNIVTDEYLQETIRNNVWDSESIERRIFYKAIRMKSCMLCYGIVKLRCLLQSKNKDRFSVIQKSKRFAVL